MRSLVYDTETTGFPIFGIPSSDPEQPYIMQMACIQIEDGEIIKHWDTIVQCPIEPHPGAFEVHKISMGRSQLEGLSLETSVFMFHKLLEWADRTVCHNTRFDQKLMKIAYHRAGMDDSLLRAKPAVCTMLTAKRAMKVGKWPKLDAAYRALVDEKGFSNAHDARADTEACARLMLALEKLGEDLVRV